MPGATLSVVDVQPAAGPHEGAARGEQQKGSERAHRREGRARPDRAPRLNRRARARGARRRRDARSSTAAHTLGPRVLGSPNHARSLRFASGWPYDAPEVALAPVTMPASSFEPPAEDIAARAAAPARVRGADVLAPAADRARRRRRRARPRHGRPRVHRLPRRRRRARARPPPPGRLEALHATLERGRAADDARPRHAAARRRSSRRCSASCRRRCADGRIQFCGPTGADAVEAAVKLARTATGRRGVIAFGGAYHGMTQGALELSGAHAPKAALGDRGGGRPPPAVPDLLPLPVRRGRRARVPSSAPARCAGR